VAQGLGERVDVLLVGLVVVVDGVEAALAKHFSISTTPVREALRRLDHEGLVRLAHIRSIRDSVTAVLGSEGS
jgi:predicted ArsR family transcriptional regulator